MAAPPDITSITWDDAPTIRSVLREAAGFLARAGIEDAALDARYLTAHALGIDRAALLRDSDAAVDACSLGRLSAGLRRRAAHEPVSRIIGARDFHGLTFELNAATLDPRPDTETIVAVASHLAARLSRDPDRPLRILDLGTGTGAIALALLDALPDAEAVATDISTTALAAARRNAERLGLAERAHFVHANWLENIDGEFHLVVSNPPYIRSDDIAGLAPEVALWDPRAALDGGPDGLDAYRAILATAGRVLAPGGWIVFEVGHDQSREVLDLAIEKGFYGAPLDWAMLKDLGGNVRCVAVATPHCDNKKTLGIDNRSV